MPETRVQIPRRAIGLRRTRHIDHSTGKFAFAVKSIQQIDKTVGTSFVSLKHFITGATVHLGFAVHSNPGAVGLPLADVIEIDGAAAVSGGSKAVTVSDRTPIPFIPRLFYCLGHLPGNKIMHFTAGNKINFIGVLRFFRPVGRGSGVSMRSVDNDFSGRDFRSFRRQIGLDFQKHIPGHTDHIC